MPQTLLIVILVACVFACNREFAEEKPQAEEVVFRYPIDTDRTLVVLRGPFVSCLKLKGLMAPEVLQNVVGFFQIRVEIQQVHEAPVVLWTRLLWEPPAESLRGFDVLGVLVKPNQVILATGEFSGVLVWNIDILAGTVSRADLFATVWSQRSTAFHVDRHNTGIAFSKSDKTGSLTVEVVELDCEEANQHTFYEQVGKEWKFRFVRKFLVPVPKKEPAPQK